jgi:hypothetical protein
LAREQAPHGIRPPERFATHSGVSPHAADGCIARMMRKPNRARLASDAALLLLWGSGLLVRHGCSNGGGRLLLPDAVAEHSHDRSALKEERARSAVAS